MVEAIKATIAMAWDILKHVITTRGVVKVEYYNIQIYYKQTMKYCRPGRFDGGYNQGLKAVHWVLSTPLPRYQGPTAVEKLRVCHGRV